MELGVAGVGGAEGFSSKGASTQPNPAIITNCQQHHHIYKMADIVDAPYPISTKQAAGDVAGVMTNVMVLGFADKVVITIVQDGRLAQWV